MRPGRKEQLAALAILAVGFLPSRVLNRGEESRVLPRLEGASADCEGQDCVAIGGTGFAPGAKVEVEAADDSGYLMMTYQGEKLAPESRGSSSTLKVKLEHEGLTARLESDGVQVRIYDPSTGARSAAKWVIKKRVPASE